MDLLFQGSVRKSLQYPDENEDCFSLDFKQKRIALCDGATESFDSKRWSQILSEKYIHDPEISLKWIQEAIAVYSGFYAEKKKLLTWS